MQTKGERSIGGTLTNRKFLAPTALEVAIYQSFLVNVVKGESYYCMDVRDCMSKHEDPWTHEFLHQCEVRVQQRIREPVACCFSKVPRTSRGELHTQHDPRIGSTSCQYR